MAWIIISKNVTIKLSHYVSSSVITATQEKYKKKIEDEKNNNNKKIRDGQGVISIRVWSPPFFFYKKTI